MDGFLKATERAIAMDDTAWAVAFGLLLVLGGKLWFLDRMVWLYADMAPTLRSYQTWLR